MKSKDIILRKMLWRAGDLKHAYNVLSQLSDDNWYEVKYHGTHYISVVEDIYVDCDDDYYTYNSDLSLYMYKPDSAGGPEYYGHPDTKATRKLFAAYASGGPEGVLKMLEKVNAAIRAYLWSDLNGKEWNNDNIH